MDLEIAVNDAEHMLALMDDVRTEAIRFVRETADTDSTTMAREWCRRYVERLTRDRMRLRTLTVGMAQDAGIEVPPK